MSVGVILPLQFVPPRLLWLISGLRVTLKPRASAAWIMTDNCKVLGVQPVLSQPANKLSELRPLVRNGKDMDTELAPRLTMCSITLSEIVLICTSDPSVLLMGAYKSMPSCFIPFCQGFATRTTGTTGCVVVDGRTGSLSGKFVLVLLKMEE